MTSIEPTSGSLASDDSVSQINMSTPLSQTTNTYIHEETTRSRDEWKPEHDIILSEWADKAMCYRWLHFKSYQKFSFYNKLFTIPVIVISTLTGTANFATDSLNSPVSPLIIGSFNIIAGIVSTVQHFLKISELTEAHKTTSLAWDKLYRNVKVELTKNPDDRISAYQMLKIYKEEYNRLMETSPEINDTIIKAFMKEFKHTDTFGSVMKPEICDTLIPTLNVVYRAEKYAKKTESISNTYVNNTFAVDVSTTPDIHKINKPIDITQKIVDSFISEYIKIHNIKPSSEEIIRNLKDRVDQETLRELVSI